MTKKSNDSPALAPQEFQTKSVTKLAIQLTVENGQAIADWIHESGGAAGFNEQDNTLYIYTLESRAKHPLAADIGDWIIRGIKGEFYPCKPDIFKDSYSPALAEPAAPAQQKVSTKLRCSTLGSPEPQQVGRFVSPEVTAEHTLLELLAKRIETWEEYYEAFTSPFYQTSGKPDPMKGLRQCIDELKTDLRGAGAAPSKGMDERNEVLEEAALEALSFLEEVSPEKWPPYGLTAERNRWDSGNSAIAARNIAKAIRKLKIAGAAPSSVQAQELTQQFVAELGEHLSRAWHKYTDLFFTQPHGTGKQLAALIQLCPELKAALSARASSPSSATEQPRKHIKTAYVPCWCGKYHNCGDGPAPGYEYEPYPDSSAGTLEGK